MFGGKVQGKMVHQKPLAITEHGFFGFQLKIPAFQSLKRQSNEQFYHKSVICYKWVP